MNETQSIPSITIPQGHYTGGPQGICVVCARSLIRDSRPFMWAACVTCRKFDRAIARAMGGKVFLPLGLHSIMNGAAISVQAEDYVQKAQIDAVMSVARNWESLFKYKERIVLEMASSNQWEKQDLVPWVDWSHQFPSTFESSLAAYMKLIQWRYSWLEKILPDASSVSWLTQMAMLETTT